MPNKRLLTDEELKEALHNTYGFGVVIERGHFGVSKAQDTKTLKAVGEWLDFNCLPLPQPFENKGEPTGYFVSNSDIEALKRGEFK